MNLKSLTRPVLGAALALFTSASSLALAGVPPKPTPPQAPGAPVPQPQPQQPQPQPSQQTSQQQARPRIDVVFVLDTTGSMAGLIEGAKQKIFSIASRIAQGKPTPQVRVGLVAYRDVGDAYVTKRYELTEDLDGLFTHLRALQADGGGDTPEHVGRGLGEAVSKLSWDQSRETMKLIFLVGDAPPAQRNDDWNFKHWVKRAAEKHIVVNTVRCGGDAETEVHWKLAAKTTDGRYESLEQSGGMVAVATPYDADLAKVNAELASKTMYAGKKEAQVANRARAEQMAGLAPEAAADRIQFMKTTRGAGKGSGAAASVSSAPAAVGGAVDLAAQPEALASVKEEELPQELQGLDAAGRDAKVKQLAGERKALEEKAAKLAAERDAWRMKNVADKDDSFDANVMKGVKEKAAKHGITY
ncbi:vWA domain-containing protein [Archangium lansingense]|uniref:VWA domain-containing protein n=1 Tax=Archangium lansingense TaxID=2995310 RepID=A0ABT4A094_9BACT|nr:vWA domain-containing protein [Archangium lansinium]MCY1075065.1 VWA domain-containing protein [Archangium lansinium]